MKNLLLITMLLGVGYNQCNESNWQEYYPEMEGCFLGNANLSGANLSGADLIYANLYGADLSFAHLIGANLSYADLFMANLEGAHLEGANLSYASLYWANLEWACLEGAINFTQTDYTGTPILEGCTYGGGDCSYEDFEDTDEDG